MNVHASKIHLLGPWACGGSTSTASLPGASPTAIAFQLVATLEAYEQDALRLDDAGSDPALWAEVSAQMDRIQGYCAAFPSLNRPLTALFIRHEEWLHALRLVHSGDSPEARHRLAEVRGAHADSVAILRNQCLQRLTRRVPDRPR